ncbi:MAG: fimbria/pilus periplasmic chaperone [Proteobacteria bacterium]|nr:fimbria/pilus periplasmic chaperone [Pseudomonadota bacterium]MBU1387405.1 fimbria/pilus periplasmic chaperone [Pseudomonadota bacterium]MBU1541690.1 fimbria/pilus periplasmic chaperone [Pseudomonadota bacterium]MBU2482007.1 fimbria/pilus periplasmic chaperone [Pseudomonadota bacterium]
MKPNPYLNVDLKITLVISWIILSFFYMPASVSASANDKAVLIAPTRVIFEGRTRAAAVKLINPNDIENTYKISLVSIRMDEHGTRSEVQSPDPEELFAQSLIRFSPRRATIPAQGWQTVRLMVKKPRDLPEGEYRSQLKVSPLPKQKGPDDQQNTENISISIDIVFNVSIPVIIRHGKSDVRVTPRTPRLVVKEGQYFLETLLEREGKFSVFADVRAFVIPNTGEKQKNLISEIKGISIYSQNQTQQVLLPIKDKAALTNGLIEIDIVNREKENAPLLGSKQFDLD